MIFITKGTPDKAKGPSADERAKAAEDLSLAAGLKQYIKFQGGVRQSHACPEAELASVFPSEPLAAGYCGAGAFHAEEATAAGANSNTLNLRPEAYS